MLTNLIVVFILQYMFTCIRLPCCTPETYTVLCHLYISKAGENPKTMKHLEESKRENLCDLELGKAFLRSSKPQSINPPPP